MSSGPFGRASALSQLAGDRFDVCVIGGGITGAGTALDAAARGLRVALVEKGDFAEGTSSRSSKLVHGGLRYLQQREVRLVAEALAERQRLRRNAPHLVQDLAFVIPLFAQSGRVRRGLTRAIGGALWAYDLCGGARIGKLHRRLNPDEMQARFPMLPTERLAGGYQYYDCQTDDARLTLTIARTAVLDHGAVAANGVTAVEVTRDGTGAVQGVSARTTEGHEFEISCSVVVNATGVWASEMAEGIQLRPAKGVHITLPRSLLNTDYGLILPSPVKGRSVFVVPWGDACYLGTTDTDYHGPLDNPHCTATDTEELLEAVRAHTTVKVSQSDIIGAWAGLRPLAAEAGSPRTTDLSRRHRVNVANGVVTITGGKLTTYRRMAVAAVNEATELLEVGKRIPRSSTRLLPLRGAADPTTIKQDLETAGLSADAARHLAKRYGSEAQQVADLAASNPDLGQPLADGLPYLRAEVVWAAREEMARSVDDVLSRRVPMRHRNLKASRAAAHATADLLGNELGWSAAESHAQADAYREMSQADTAFITQTTPEVNGDTTPTDQP